ncbi:hypothetical protein ASF83_13305 [Plantibacter sp. Leaf171]|uniref:hypothetical protein n=1 Tax=unclassified Plantibacter TaxID=2624265 RepID=UPI0006FA281C|nr:MULTISPECIES: hypothetical protein [unclassified Plantibacter]KQM16746.1 hypothetical protein ASE44_13315 [Plantibacter sp. Leaf1]KQQ52848.1 hypothetical protein ASF68_11315 [Plantibacter sp. Leaf314]KQR59882.1 hypothetical protein ASF83_13305 [Plantibacter sp. Leaf171]
MDIGTIAILIVIALLAVGAVWYVVRRDRAARTDDAYRSHDADTEHERERAKALAQGTGGEPRRGGGPMGV